MIASIILSCLKMLSLQSLLYATLPVLCLAKLYKMNKLRRLRKTYFVDKTVLITGASSGLGKGNQILNRFA